MEQQRLTVLALHWIFHYTWNIFFLFLIELHVKNRRVNCLFLSESPLYLPGVFLIYEIVRQLLRKFYLKWIQHKYFAMYNKMHLSLTHGIISVGYLTVSGRSKNKLVFHSTKWVGNGTSTPEDYSEHKNDQPKFCLTPQFITGLSFSPVWCVWLCLRACVCVHTQRLFLVNKSP